MPSIRTLPPTPADVTEIVALPNRIVRNLRITDCYARLSNSLRDITGEGANWCTFATWASRQAGCTIRGEDLGDRIGDISRQGWSIRHPIRGVWRVLLRRGMFDPSSRLGRLVRAVNTPFDAFERASEAVAEGNLKVFEEIGLQFAEYLRCCGDPAAFAQFLDGLKPGPAPEGQELLRAAFAHYQQARMEQSPARRAQWMLLANLEVGFHEQTRLQPEIERSMHAGLDTAQDLKRRLLEHFGLSWPGRAAAAALAFPAKYYRQFERELTRRIISDTLMVLRTPAGVLNLDKNIDEVPPVIFGQLDLADLLALASKVDPAGPGCKGHGADDWANLEQRMHYIYHLFSTFHEKAEFFQPPFTPEQAAAFNTGRIPSGRL